MTKVEYYYNKENKDYIMVNPKIGISSILVNDNVSPEVKSLLSPLYYFIFEYERNCSRNPSINEIAVFKYSKIGQLITSRTDLFFCMDDYISYDKVVNAFNIAVFEDNIKMSNKLMSCFKSRISGTRDELSEKIDEKIINYIVENSSFDQYLEQLDEVEKEPISYVVFEDNKYVLKTLVEKGSQKVKK